MTDTPYFLNIEPPNKAPLADGSSEDGTSSSENPDEDNIAVLAATLIELQAELNPPSASVKSHLKKRYSPHVLVPHRSPYHNFIEKTRKINNSDDQRTFPEASQMRCLLLQRMDICKVDEYTLLQILDWITKCSRQKTRL